MPIQQFSTKERLGLAIAGVLLVASVSLGTLQWTRVGSPDSRRDATAVAAPKSMSSKPALPVASTGWIEPEQGVLQVAAPLAAGHSPIVARLLVKEGDLVQPGQTLAELQGLADLQAAVRQAQSRWEAAQRRLAQVKAGPRTSDVEAAHAQLDRLLSERKGVQSTLERQEALLAKDYIPRVQVDATRLRLDQLGYAIAEARQRLHSISEVRSTDVDVADADTRAVEADVARARADLSQGVVKSPQKGRILRVLVHAGEAVGPAGLLEFAPAGRMVVLAEIYETDASRVHVGQKATVSSEVLPEPVSGTVTWISPQIEKRQSPSLDPAAFSEARVFNTRILLDDKPVLTDRIHAKVNVLIQP